jgi:hypothetical protein
VSGAQEMRELAVDLSTVSARMVGPMRTVMLQAGESVAEQWRTNARATAGEHGRLYPDAIGAELKFSLGIEVEIGPDPDKPQGEMSFEFGSKNQPPHLDGAKAVDAKADAVVKMIDSAVGFLLP